MVKSARMIGVALATAAALTSFATAGPAKHEPGKVAAALPPYDILTDMRGMGFYPISRPALRGPYYVQHALDPRGVEVRVVADAQFGDILSIVPASPLNRIYAPSPDASPRIIHVPQPHRHALPHRQRRGDTTPLPPRKAPSAPPPAGTASRDTLPPRRD